MRSARMLALSVLTLTLVSGAGATTKEAPKQTPRQQPSTRLDAKTTTLIAETTVQVWNCQDKLILLGQRKTRDNLQSPWSLPKSAKYRTWVLKQRIKKQAACLKKLHRIAYEWNWQAFPSWIIRLGVCESGGSGGAAPGEPNWFAEGSSSHGTFYSAFNIGRTRYDGAAHHMGVRGWNEGHGVPSPWEQAMTVIGYVRIHGDGFTGRCAGIARSTWN